jgi:hypothetical protein
VTPNSMRLISLYIGWLVVFRLQFLESDRKYFFHGRLYNFSLMERPNINKVWGSYHNFHLARKIFLINVELKRGNIIGLWVTILNSKGIKLQIFIRRNVG